LTFLNAIATQPQLAENAQPLSFFVDGELLLVLCLGALGSTPLPARALSVTAMRLPRVAAGVTVIGSAVLLLASLANIASGSYSPFIYLRF
jgi:hypothetical protein